MRNKSDLILTCMLIGFFAFFVYDLPHAPTGNFQSQLTQNTQSFANTVAAEYNDAQAAGTITTTDDLTEIAPAAGDTQAQGRMMPQGLMTPEAAPAAQ